MAAVVIIARNQTIFDLVDQCAKGDLAFDQCCQAIARMGYKTTSVYEMVLCRQADLRAAVDHRSQS